MWRPGALDVNAILALLYMFSSFSTAMYLILLPRLRATAHAAAQQRRGMLSRARRCSPDEGIAALAPSRTHAHSYRQRTVAVCQRHIASHMAPFSARRAARYQLAVGMFCASVVGGGWHERRGS